MTEYFSSDGEPLLLEEVPSRWQWSDEYKKKCSKCKRIKPLNGFHGGVDTLDGKRKSCKECVNKERRDRYHEKDKFNYHTANGKMTPALANAKYRAKKKGIDFDITRDYIIEVWNSQDGRCAITKEKFQLDCTDRYSTNSAHLDRIDSSKGYIKGNIQWIIGWVNIMKNNYTMEEFKDKISMIHKALNT